MDNEKKITIFRCFILAFIIVLVATAQNTLSMVFQIGGARCFIIVPVVVAVGMFENEGTSAFLGLFAGMLIDMVSGVQMGYNAIILCFTALCCSLFVSNIMRSTILTSLIFNSISIVVYVVLYWLFFMIFAGVEDGAKSLFTFYLPSAVYTFIVSPFIFSFIRAIRKRLI